MHPLSDSITGHDSLYKIIFYPVWHGIIKWSGRVPLPHVTKPVHLRVWQNLSSVECPDLILG